MTKKKNETPKQREERLTYLRSWRQKNLESVKAKAKVKRDKRSPEEKESKATYQKEWRAKQGPDWQAKEDARVKKAKKVYRSSKKGKDRETTYRKKYLQLPETKLKVRDNAFKHNSGITRSEADQLALDQGGLCKICGLAPAGKRHHARLHVDHCHESGTYRGMLCGNCNTTLGLMKENPERLRAAASYLENS